MKPKILITGPSGMGKTTLAKHLAEKFGLPYLSIGILDNVCKCHGLKTHQDIIDYSKKHPLFGGQLQMELMAIRSHKFNQYKNEGFVTDRGPIDSLVYSELQVVRYMGDNSHVFMESLYKRALSDLRIFTHVILIPWIDGWEIEDNGVRVVDSNFQKECSDLYLHYISKITNSSLTSIREVRNTMITRSFYPHYMILKEEDYSFRIDKCKTFFQLTNAEVNISNL